MEDEVGGACGTLGVRERCLQAYFGWEARRKEITGKTLA